MDSEEAEGFFVVDETGLEGIQEQQKCLTDVLHKPFVNPSRRKPTDLFRKDQGLREILKQWGRENYSKGPPPFLLRLGKSKETAENILFRNNNPLGDYTNNQEADKIFPSKDKKNTKGCSLLTLFGCIFRGDISAFVYISPKVKTSTLLEGLPPELTLFPDPDVREKGAPPDHYMLPISPEGIQPGTYITAERLKNCLHTYGLQFKNTGVRIKRFFNYTEKEKEKEWRSIIDQFYQSELLRKDEYRELYAEIIEIKKDSILVLKKSFKKSKNKGSWFKSREN